MHEILKKKVSVFRSAKDTEVFDDRMIASILQEISNPPYLDSIKKLRAGDDSVKPHLPMYAMHGVFEGLRRKQDFIESSGLIIIDIDDIEDDLEEVKEDIISNIAGVFAVMISPSGTGIKALVRVDEEFITADNYREVGKIIAKDFSIYGKIDSLSITDCLIGTYDPNYKINPDVDIRRVILREVEIKKVDLEPLDPDREIWDDAEEFYSAVLHDNICQKSDNNYHFIQISLLDLARFGFKHPKYDLSFVIDCAEACHKRSADNKKRFDEAAILASTVPQSVWPYKFKFNSDDDDEYEGELNYSNYIKSSEVVSAGSDDNDSIEDQSSLIDYSNLNQRMFALIQEGDRVGREISLKNFAGCFRFKGTGILTITGIPGHGKANPNSSKVYTPSGYKLMGNMAVGDQVLTIGGRANVIGVFPQGKKKIYEIRFNDGSCARSTEDHIWACKNKGERVKRKPFSNRTLAQIKQNYLYNDGSSIYSIPVELSHFKEQRLSIHPYLLGVLIGDGYLNHGNVRLHNPDIAMFNYIEPMLEPFNCKVSNLKFDNGCYTGFLSKKSGMINKLANEIKDLGLDTTAYCKHIPEEYLYNSIKNRMDLLGGLLDTDGYIAKDGTIEYNTSSSRLKDDVVLLVQSLGGTVKIRERFPQYEYGGEIKVSEHKHYTIVIRIPTELGNPFITIKAKRDRWRPRKKYQPSRFIREIVEVDEEEATCIMIDHPSHLYFTDNFVITHNTEFADQIILDLARLYDEETLIVGYEQSPEEHLIKIVRKAIGVDVTCPSYWENKSNIATIQETTDKIIEKIRHVDTAKVGSEINKILKVAADWVVERREAGGNPRYLLLDPFNMLSIKGKLNGHEKIEEILRRITMFSHQMGIMVILVAHPFKMKKDEKTGLYEIPDFYSVKGSSAFFEMSYHGICVYRRGGIGGTEVLVRILKVKQNNLGTAGADVLFSYQRASGRYIPLNDEGSEMAGDHYQKDWFNVTKK